MMDQQGTRVLKHASQGAFGLRIFFSLALFLSMVETMWANPGQRLVPLGEDTYRYLRGMALEQGVLPPSFSFPFPMAEMQSELRRILSAEKGTSSEAIQAAREGIQRYLSQKPFYAERGEQGGSKSESIQDAKGFAFYPDLRINAEGYLHTNREYDWWAYGFQERKPFVGLLLDTSIFDSLSLYLDVTVQKDPFQVGGDPDNYTNLLTNPSQFDLNMPYRAGISVGGDHWNLWLGRDKLSWGNGRSGNLLLSDADLYHEGVRFTTWWDRFKFTFLLLGLESWRMETDDKGNPYPWPDPQTSIPIERFKMFLAHRLEFNLRSNLRLTFNESIVYGGKYPDLRVFNPLIVYHNFYIKEWSNSLMTIELDWVPFPGVYIYGQYAQDQLSTIFEKDTYGKDVEPNAMGLLLGFELQRVVGTTNNRTNARTRSGSGKAWLRGGYEFVKTDPWLYIRETPYVSFFSTRRVHSEARKSVLGDKNYYFLHTPLGYLYGPDAIVNTVWVSYEVPDQIRLFLEYSLILKGENEVTTRFLTGDAAWDLHTPSGTPDVRNVVTVGVYYTCLLYTS
ncbi:MAG: capsule assembly Wzi family protein, partial [Spirochaetes bacterium]|nr:capsule assembly Wzi family protein [Spirochaetota bacterium]